MKCSLFFLLLSASVAIAQTSATPQAAPKVQAWHEAEAAWQAMQPQLFSEAGSKASIGKYVVIHAKVLSLGTPVVARVDDGTTVYVTHVNKADRDSLREYRRSPSTVAINGVIRAVDPSKHSLTVQSVGTYFGS